MRISRSGERGGRLILVTGGAASGKSEYAEQLAAAMRERSGGGASLWYAAAMRADVSDQELMRRIERHRRMRAGKGFLTVELGDGPERLHAAVSPGDTVLLEDLSNLLANEMFAGGGICYDADRRIAEELLALRERGVGVVAVGNTISEDLPPAGSGTGAFVRSLMRLQSTLCREADRAEEVVCGVAVRYQG